MVLAFRRFAKHLTVALSIILMLGAVMASGQAKAAHTVGMINSAALPCHHALGSDGAMPNTKSPLDLCRELCLSQAPDTLIVPASIVPDVSVVTATLPANAFTIEDGLRFDATTHPIAPAHKLRRAPYPATVRLLI